MKELDWQPLINLPHRSWFHRLWVIQEVANAKCAVVLCGGQKIPWSVVSSALWDLKSHGLATIFLDQYAGHACVNVSAIEDIKVQRMTKQQLWGPTFQEFTDPLFHVMLATRFCECSDPKDRVFAVMSIAQGRDIYLYDWEVDFNYSLSTSELFKRFAIWDGSLRSLACATPCRSELLRMYYESGSSTLWIKTGADIIQLWIAVITRYLGCPLRSIKPVLRLALASSHLHRKSRFRGKKQAAKPSDKRCEHHCM